MKPTLWTRIHHRGRGGPMHRADPFAARYFQMLFSRTDLIVWRDSKQTVAPFNCVDLPGSFPLQLQSTTVLDETGDIATPLATNSFPWQTQRVAVSSFGIPFAAGWIFLDLNGIGGGGNPPEDPVARQNWVTPLVLDTSRFTVGFDAIQYDSACSANHMDPTRPGD